MGLKRILLLSQAEHFCRSHGRRSAARLAGVLDRVMLSIPMKSCDLKTDWMDGIHKLAATSYGDACAKACLQSVSVLRLAQREAAKAKVSVEKEATAAVDVLLAYYHILSRLQTPLGADARDRKLLTIQWRSAWDDADKFKHHELGYEMAATLFNVAAALSARGALAQGTDDVEAIKGAARDFQLAAGALEQVEAIAPHASFGSGCTEDLSEGCLAALRELMLAQAQACVVAKAEKDGMSAAIQQKLMMGAAAAFGVAKDALDKLALKKPEFKGVADARQAHAAPHRHASPVSPRPPLLVSVLTSAHLGPVGKAPLPLPPSLAHTLALERAVTEVAVLSTPSDGLRDSWQRRCGRACMHGTQIQACVLHVACMRLREAPNVRASVTQAFFDASARWAAAQDASAAGKYGLQQAQLQLAAAAATRAVAEAAVPEPAKAKASQLQARATESLAKVKSDNELIYYESVPSEASLDPITPKVLVRSLPITPLLGALDAQRVPQRFIGPEVCRVPLDARSTRRALLEHAARLTRACAVANVEQEAGEPLKFGDLFRILYETPRDASAALAAALAAEYAEDEGGDAGDDDVDEEAAAEPRSAVSFLRGPTRAKPLSDGRKEKSAGDGKEGKGVGLGFSRPVPFKEVQSGSGLLGSLFKGRQDISKDDGKSKGGGMGGKGATKKERAVGDTAEVEEAALQAAIAASLEEEAGGGGSWGGSGGGGGGGGDGGGGGAGRCEDRIARLLSKGGGGCGSVGAFPAPAPAPPPPPSFDAAIRMAPPHVPQRAAYAPPPPATPASYAVPPPTASYSVPAMQPPGACGAPPPQMPQHRGSYGAPPPMQAYGGSPTAFGAPPPGHCGDLPVARHVAPPPMACYGPPPGFAYAPPPPAGGGGWAPPPPPPPPPAHQPPGGGADMDGAIAQLASMGFPRDRAVDALRQSGNDVAGAANLLLGGS